MNSEIFAMIAFKKAVFESEGDEFSAYHPDYKGLFAYGKSFDECVADFKLAAEQWFINMESRKASVIIDKSFVDRKLA